MGEVIGVDGDGVIYGYVYSGLDEDYKDKGYLLRLGPSRHLTIVFNIFVWM